MKNLFMIIILGLSFLVASCAAPRGDAAKTYLLQVYATCYATDCTITQTINLDLSADVKKDQRAEARADISPTLDIAP